MATKLRKMEDNPIFAVYANIKRPYIGKDGLNYISFQSDGWQYWNDLGRITSRRFELVFDCNIPNEAYFASCKTEWASKKFFVLLNQKTVTSEKLNVHNYGLLGPDGYFMDESRNFFKNNVHPFTFDAFYCHMIRYIKNHIKLLTFDGPLTFCPIADNFDNHEGYYVQILHKIESNNNSYIVLRVWDGSKRSNSVKFADSKKFKEPLKIYNFQKLSVFHIKYDEEYRRARRFGIFGCDYCMDIYVNDLAEMEKFKSLNSGNWVFIKKLKRGEYGGSDNYSISKEIKDNCIFGRNYKFLDRLSNTLLYAIKWDELYWRYLFEDCNLFEASPSRKRAPPNISSSRSIVSLNESAASVNENVVSVNESITDSPNKSSQHKISWKDYQSSSDDDEYNSPSNRTIKRQKISYTEKDPDSSLHSRAINLVRKPVISKSLHSPFNALFIKGSNQNLKNKEDPIKVSKQNLVEKMHIKGVLNETPNNSVLEETPNNNIPDLIASTELANNNILDKISDPINSDTIPNNGLLEENSYPIISDITSNNSLLEDIQDPIVFNELTNNSVLGEMSNQIQIENTSNEMLNGNTSNELPIVNVMTEISVYNYWNDFSNDAEVIFVEKNVINAVERNVIEVIGRKLDESNQVQNNDVSMNLGKSGAGENIAIKTSISRSASVSHDSNLESAVHSIEERDFPPATNKKKDLNDNETCDSIRIQLGNALKQYLTSRDLINPFIPSEKTDKQVPIFKCKYKINSVKSSIDNGIYKKLENTLYTDEIGDEIYCIVNMKMVSNIRLLKKEICASSDMGLIEYFISIKKIKNLPDVHNNIDILIEFTKRALQRF